ncbi:MAG TPA: hypothetical protein VF582_07085 [Allosphingosinicella sp.]|jgi:hypothetical protein
MEPPHDAIRQAATALGVSLVIAAAIIGWAMPDKPQAPKYEGYVVEGRIVRLNTQNGNIVACDFNRCVRVLGNGKSLQPNSAPALAAPPAAAPAPARQFLPAPKAGPST